VTGAAAFYFYSHRQMPSDGQLGSATLDGVNFVGVNLKWEPAISRVLSRVIIHLGRMSPHGSSNLPGNSADHTNVPLFGLAPGGVYHAAECCHRRGALLPHPFTLTGTLSCA